MNVYGDPAVRFNKKKDPKTGSSLGLKGYTVGSWAPPAAKSSGTKVDPSVGYGIDNRFGGKFRANAPKGTKVSGSNVAGLAPLLSLLAVIIVIGGALKQ